MALPVREGALASPTMKFPIRRGRRKDRSAPAPTSAEERDALDRGYRYSFLGFVDSLLTSRQSSRKGR